MEGESKSIERGDRYTIGNVGDNARVMQGKFQNWIEAVNSIPNGETLKQQFKDLLEDISNDKTLNEGEQSISIKKTEEIVKSLANAQNSPIEFEVALTEGKNWFSRKASWAWNKLVDILKSETAQKTIGTITESGVKGVIQGLIG
jgi:hypothetical protein